MAQGRVLFLQDNGINESLALTELSAYLSRRGHSTQILLQRDEPLFEKRIQAIKPHLVVVPCNVYAHGWVLRTLTMLARVIPGTPVLVGGTHPTFSPDFIQEAPVSMILVGEAEIAVLELLERILSGQDYLDIPGVWVKRDGEVQRTGPAARLADLDELVPSNRMLYYRYRFMRRFPWKKFTTGRGCVNSCAFCYNNFIKQIYCGEDFVRRKSPHKVLAEIDEVRRSSTLKWVHFADDLFVTDREWLAGFCSLYTKRFALPFSCNSSADRMDRDVARLLAGAGCKVVAIGVESANEETRVSLLKKPMTNKVIEHAAACIKGAGMKLVTFNMVGLPGESLHDAFETLKYSRGLGADATRLLMAVPLPGTSMTMDAARDGYLDPSLATSFSTDLDFGANPYGPYYDTPDPKAFENLVNLAPMLSRLPPRALKLLHSLPRPLTRPGRLWMSMQEKTTYQFSLLEGLAFYLHVGNPWLRTTNYVTLI